MRSELVIDAAESAKSAVPFKPPTVPTHPTHPTSVSPLDVMPPVTISGIGRSMQPPRQFDSSTKEAPYRWALCHKANRRNAPRSETPALRVCGFFETEKEALDAKEKHLSHPYIKSLKIAVYLDEVKHIAMVPLEPERATAECTERRKNAIFESEREWKAARDMEFADNVTNRHIGSIGGMRQRRKDVLKAQRELVKKMPVPREVIETRVMEFRAATGAATGAATEAATGAATEAATGSATEKTWDVYELPDELKIKGQEAMIASIFVDTSMTSDTWQDAEAAGYEPIYILHGGYTVDAAAKIAENAVWKRYSDGETLVGDMYVWHMLDATSVNNPDIPDNYLNSEQHAIMNRKRQDEIDAQAFMELCSDAKKPLPIIDLSDPDGAGVVPVMKKGVVSEEDAKKAEEEAVKHAKIEYDILNGTPEQRMAAHRLLDAETRGGMVDFEGKAVVVQPKELDPITKVDIETVSTKKTSIRHASTEDSIREMLAAAKR